MRSGRQCEGDKEGNSRVGSFQADGNRYAGSCKMTYHTVSPIPSGSG